MGCPLDEILFTGFKVDCYGRYKDEILTSSLPAYLLPPKAPISTSFPTIAVILRATLHGQPTSGG